MTETLAYVYQTLFGLGLVTAPVYVAVAGLVSWAVYLRQGSGQGFWRWLFPARIWRHPSHNIDLQLFALGRLLAVLGLFGGVALTTLIVAGLDRLSPVPRVPAESLGPVALAFLLWLPSDFAIYWSHRLFHRWHRIWPLHAVHHSAAVMTPFTTYRQHPLALVLSDWAQAVTVGLFQGLLIGTLTEGAPVAQIAGINLFLVLANAALAALHHSHVWLSYGPVIEHIVISPAQHQIHHSADPKHHDRNFGNSLAIWDWMFGTLYVIRDQETLVLGLSGPQEEPLMSQRLWPILCDPVRRMLKAGG